MDEAGESVAVEAPEGAGEAVEVSEGSAPEVAPEAAPEAPQGESEVSEEVSEDVPAGAVIEAPQWSDEEWGAWDGTRDTLAEQYHNVFDRLSDRHTSEVDQLRSVIAQRDASIKALFAGDEDPQINVLTEQVSERDAQILEMTEKLSEAQKALESIRDEYEAERQAETEAELSRFNERHAWILADDVSQDVKNAVSKLIDAGILPTAAADYVKGKPQGYQEAFAELVNAGASPEVAARTAEKVVAKRPSNPKPEPKPGAEFVTGSGPSPAHGRVPKKSLYNGSLGETREAMADAMFA